MKFRWRKPKAEQAPRPILTARIEDDPELIVDENLNEFTLARVELFWHGAKMPKQLVVTWRGDDIIDLRLVARGGDSFPLHRRDSLAMFDVAQRAWYEYKARVESQVD